MKIRVAYKTINEIEVEVDEKYAECIRLADLPWGQFPADQIDQWYDDCEEMYHEIRAMLPQLDPYFDYVVDITTEKDNPIWEN